ncbi:MAG: anthranilate phosphoribosyltransferase [Rhizobiaceae bacterium]|nr:anthranilate phosphoribosyltransferase [Rhizobiaceae bacterium]
MSDIKHVINRLANGESLSRDETQSVFDIIMSGDATNAQIGAVLMGLRLRGETEDEFAGAVDAMRAKMLPVDAPADAIDIVGTGGDAKGSYNISTCTALVVAGCGVPVAKHGNRSLSSKSGASDVLTSLGVNIELSPSQITDCINDAGIGFMFAPAHHSAVRHVGPARVEMATRTIFNLLGPMCNPAGVKRQLLGVFAPQWVLTAAKVLQKLGSEKVWVVYGEGFDEVTITGTTQVAELNNGSVKTFELTPNDFGFDVESEDAIAGGDADVNAKALRAVLAGEPSAYRNMVIMNSACSLVVAEKAKDIKEGTAMASEAIDSGAAAKTLEKLVAVSNQGNA